MIGFRLRRMIIVCCRIFRRLIVACCVTSYVSSTSAVVASSMIIVSVCNEHQSLIGFRQIIVVCSRIFRRLIVACWCWLLWFFLNWLPIAADHLTALVTDGLAVVVDFETCYRGRGAGVGGECGNGQTMVLMDVSSLLEPSIAWDDRGEGHDFFWILTNDLFLTPLRSTLLNDFIFCDVCMSEIEERFQMNGKNCPWTPLGLR